MSCSDNVSCGGGILDDVFATTGTFGGESSQDTQDPSEIPAVESRDVSIDCKYSLSVILQLPKFSKGYKPEFFDEFIENNVGDDLVRLGRLSYPNEWQVVVKTKEVREKLLRLRRLKISGRTCWIKPLSSAEIRGNIHWLPIEIPDSSLHPLLEEYGEILYLESEPDINNAGDLRRFSLFLKKGMTKNHIPHYLNVEKCRALITVQGREPMCFHCRDIGHRKVDCIKHQLRMHEMGTGGDGSVPHLRRPRARGKRHKSNLLYAALIDNSKIATKSAVAVQPKSSTSKGKVSGNKGMAIDASAKVGTTQSQPVTSAVEEHNNKKELNAIKLELEPIRKEMDNVQELLNTLKIDAGLNLSNPKPEKENCSISHALKEENASIEESSLVKTKVSDEPQCETLQALSSDGPVPKLSKNKKKKKKKH